MFRNLVESSSHKVDSGRRSWFFLGTLTAYALIFMAISVGSIYAYNAHVENQNLELVALVTPVESAQMQQPRSAAPRQAANNNRNQRPLSVRTEIIAPTTDPTKVPKGVSVTPQTVPPVTPGMPVALGKANIDYGVGGSGKQGSGNLFGGDFTGGRNEINGGELVKDTPPPPVMKKETVRPPVTKSMGVVNGMATDLPKPVFSAIARAAGAYGMVTVQVLIDENGKVISARALSGHPLLQKESVQAAYRARFTPTLLSNQPVKVSGIITYNFVKH